MATKKTKKPSKLLEGCTNSDPDILNTHLSLCFFLNKNVKKNLKHTTKHVTCHVSHVTYHMSHVTCHVSFVSCHMSHFTCDMSCVTCHISYVTCLMAPNFSCPEKLKKVNCWSICLLVCVYLLVPISQEVMIA